MGGSQEVIARNGKADGDKRSDIRILTSVVSAISGERKPGMNVIGTSRIGVVFPRLILDRSHATCIPNKRRFLTSFPLQSDVL
jgi:hypothetical protein